MYDPLQAIGHHLQLLIFLGCNLMYKFTETINYLYVIIIFYKQYICFVISVWAFPFFLIL